MFCHAAFKAVQRGESLFPTLFHRLDYFVPDQLKGQFCGLVDALKFWLEHPFVCHVLIEEVTMSKCFPLKPIFLILVLAILVSSAVPPAVAEPPDPIPASAPFQIFLPRVTREGWMPRFSRVTGQTVCVDPLQPVLGTASALAPRQCLSQSYLTVNQDNDSLTFLGNIPHGGNVTGIPWYQFKEIKDFLEGGYRAGTAIVEEGDGTIYWIDMSKVQDEVLPDEVGIDLTPAASVDWPAYILALNRYLFTVDPYPRFTIPTNLGISNFSNTSIKTPASCGMDGIEVRVTPAVYGHSITPPRLKIGWYETVIYEGGIERPVTPSEIFCMLPDPLDIADTNYQYLSLRRLRLNEPSFAPINVAVENEMKIQPVYVPQIEFGGMPIPQALPGTDWGMIAQASGEAAVIFLVGWYTRGTGAFQTFKVFLLGPAACVQEWADLGLCEVKSIPQQQK